MGMRQTRFLEVLLKEATERAGIFCNRAENLACDRLRPFQSSRW